MEKKKPKTFILGNAEFNDYELKENFGDVKIITDGELIDGHDRGMIDPNHNGGNEHKCTSCGEGVMKEYEQRWDCERWDCTNCGITVEFEQVYRVSIY